MKVATRRYKLHFSDLLCIYIYAYMPHTHTQTERERERAQRERANIYIHTSVNWDIWDIIISLSVTNEP